MSEETLTRDLKNAVRLAYKAVGTRDALAKKLGISGGAISQWTAVPPMRVVEVERITKIPRHVLRPDLYDPPVALESTRP